jgi:GTP pyrophosphokinase
MKPAPAEDQPVNQHKSSLPEDYFSKTPTYSNKPKEYPSKAKKPLQLTNKAYLVQKIDRKTIEDLPSKEQMIDFNKLLLQFKSIEEIDKLEVTHLLGIDAKLLDDLKIDNLDELYFNIAILKYLPNTIINKLLPKKEQELKIYNKEKYSNNDILVEGYHDILTYFASCCNPVYGEEIVGYVTKGNGIKIHSKNCPNVSNTTDRIVDVKWSDKQINKYKVLLNIYLVSNEENLSDLINIASKDNIFIESFNLNNKTDSYYYEISIRVGNINDLNKFIDDLKAINYVLKVERVFN